MLEGSVASPPSGWGFGVDGAAETAACCFLFGVDVVDDLFLFCPAAVFAILALRSAASPVGTLRSFKHCRHQGSINDGCASRYTGTILFVRGSL